MLRRRREAAVEQSFIQGSIKSVGNILYYLLYYWIRCRVLVWFEAFNLVNCWNLKQKHQRLDDSVERRLVDNFEQEVGMFNKPWKMFEEIISRETARRRRRRRRRYRGLEDEPTKGNALLIPVNKADKILFSISCDPEISLYIPKYTSINLRDASWSFLVRMIWFKKMAA